MHAWHGICRPNVSTIGLQTGCMVIVPAPMVRLPDSMCMPYGPRLWVGTPCNNDIIISLLGPKVSMGSSGGPSDFSRACTDSESRALEFSAKNPGIRLKL